MNNEQLIHGFDFDKIDPSTHKEKDPSQKKTNSYRLKKFPEKPCIDNVIDMIFDKMRQKGGFPSFSKQISDINKILKLKYASAKDIANVIIKDFSLSNKLLELVNSSFYGQFSNEGISSVEQAMIILGADQVQQAAASLMLFEHMQANSHSNDLKNTAVKTFISGLIAKELAKELNLDDTEEFLICAMFYKLGANLIAYYFSEKGKIIKRLSSSKEVTEQQASQAILGISFQKLGIGVAKKWGLPDNIIRSMSIGPPQKVSALKTSGRIEALGLLASLSNDLCDIQFNPIGQNKDADLRAVVSLYRNATGIDENLVGSVLSSVLKKIRTHSSHLNIDIKDLGIKKNGQL